MKVIIDNNFFCNFNLLSINQQEQLKRAISCGQLSFYGTLELICEFLCGGSNVQKQFGTTLNFLLNHCHGIFNQSLDILSGEIGISNAKEEFINWDEVDNIKNIVNGKYNEEAMQSLCKAIREQKERQHQTEKEIRQIVLNETYKKDVRSSRPIFEEYRNENAQRGIMLDILCKIDNQNSISSNKRNEIIFSEKLYPYFHAYCTNMMILDYYQNILEKNAQWGDNLDICYLTHLKAVDCLVSNDSRLKELARLIYGDSKKIFSLIELANFLNNYVGSSGYVDTSHNLIN